jgi:hypothetical protein
MLAAALLALSVVAHAQPNLSNPSDEDRVGARALMDAGRSRERAGDYEGALDAYLGADRIMAVPTTGLSVGRMQIAVGKLVEARNTLLIVARSEKKPGEPRPFTKARKEAEVLVQGLEGRIPTILIELTGAPSEVPVQVTVDGERVPSEEVSTGREVNPGRRVVVATAEGFRTARKALTLEEGASQVVYLELEPLPEDEPDEPEADSGGLSPLVWVGFGAGAVGLTIGAITGGLAAARASALDDECVEKVCPPDRESDLDALNAAAHASTAFFIIGGIGVTLGVVSLLVLSPEEDEPDQAATLHLAASPNGLLLRGRW